MLLIVYSGQRYKIKIRKTNLRTIIFGWERKVEGQGKEGWENWGGRQGQAGTRAGTAGDGLRPLSAVP